MRRENPWWPVLPEGWDGYELPFEYRGSRLLLQVRGGEARLSLREGSPVDAVVRGEKCRIC